MKIAIFSDYSNNNSPKEVEGKISRSGGWDRHIVVEELDRLPYTHEVLTEEAFYDATDYLREKRQ